MPLSSQTARTVVLTGLSDFTSSLFNVGRMEAAKVRNRCRDWQQSAIEERTKWSHRNMLHRRMSQWEYGKDIEYLDEKSEHAGISSFSGSERGTGNEFPISEMRPSEQASRPELGLEGVGIWRPSRSGRQHQPA